MVLDSGDILNDFDRWVVAFNRNARHREIAKSSLEIYNRIIKKLKEFILEKNIKSLRDINQDFILEFLEYLEDNSKVNRYATKTKILYISILRSFFMYISNNNDELYTYENEFKGIVPKNKNKSKKLKYLSEDNVKKLIEYLDNNLNKNRHYSYIHSLGIKLMLFAGLRISEVLNLRLEDIYISDLKNENGERDFYEIYLRDTKSKEEQIALIKISHIKKELEYFTKLNRKYIFQGKNSTKIINRSNFYVSVGKIMKKLNINQKGLHLFRHTCAMGLYRKTGNILVVKETLRHADIKTTMIYAKAEKSDIAKAMR
jgi:integrase/recombinase XerD